MNDTIIRITGFQPVPQAEGWKGALVTLDWDLESFTHEIIPFIGWQTVERYYDRISDWPDISASALEPVFWHDGEATSPRELNSEDYELRLLAPGGEPDWESMEARIRWRCEKLEAEYAKRQAAS